MVKLWWIILYENYKLWKVEFLYSNYYKKKLGLFKVVMEEEFKNWVEVLEILK